MRLCRFEDAGRVGWGLYDSTAVLGVNQLAAKTLAPLLDDRLKLNVHHVPIELSWEAALPVGSAAWVALVTLLREFNREWQELRTRASGMPGPMSNGCQLHAIDSVKLLPPVAAPPKLLLLAGNYAEHVVEQGGVAAEKEHTFPYVFMKPPSTTLVGNGSTFTIPSNSPDKLDHEVELAVVIGKRLHSATAAQARQAIAGYTIINDISNRGFRPNPNRQARPRDTFFDWQHGKWHDGSCPCGPCMTLADEIPDPQQLKLTLSIDGEVRQSGSTAQMIFSIYEVIEFISSFMTLEPGDIISTGTPSGVGNATGRYLTGGITMSATIEKIGELVTGVAQASSL